MMVITIVDVMIIMVPESLKECYTYWTILTKSFYISKDDFNTKDYLKHTIKFHDDPFLLKLHNVPTQYDQKIELIIKLYKQIICYDNFSNGISI